MTQQTMEIRPSLSGKLSTFFQLLAVALVLVGLVRPDVVSPRLEQAVFYAAGVLTTAAGVQYVYRGLGWVQSRGQGGVGTPA
jgi:phosphatidylglycerophosphate synthase